MAIRFIALPTEIVQALHQGRPDAYGHPPERQISTGKGVPCRHCLRNVGEGEPFLLLAHRPFRSLQPYAKTGPIFLHAAPRKRAEPSGVLPDNLASPEYILRGYDQGERIIYGTGAVVPSALIIDAASKLFVDANVAFIHLRSASNNCYQCRIERA